MSRRPNAMRQWLTQATPEQARALAKAAKTSVAHLRHIATGRRGVSAELAQRLAHAATAPKMPPLYQTELCAACARCPLVK